MEKNNGKNLNTSKNDTDIIVSILQQYIKDISFENPKAPEVLIGEKINPEINLGFEINTSKKENDQYEIELEIQVKSEYNSTVIFLLEMKYAGLFLLKNIPENEIEIVCLVECPKLLFPYARQIISNIISGGGFEPLMIDPINFGLLYRNYKKSQN
tara:strand:- start:3657 stop:4124 length:468 start_codon:yes stop_codon:yes gene_type:complete